MLLLIWTYRQKEIHHENQQTALQADIHPHSSHFRRDAFREHSTRRLAYVVSASLGQGLNKRSPLLRATFPAALFLYKCLLDTAYMLIGFRCCFLGECSGPSIKKCRARSMRGTNKDRRSRSENVGNQTDFQALLRLQQKLIADQ